MVLPYKQIITLADVGSFHIATWGFLVVIGFLLGLWVISKEAKRRGINFEHIYSLALWLLVGGILGARIGWILTEGWGVSFYEALKFTDGGMIWHGGLLGGLSAFYIYSRFKKINFLSYLDVFALGIPLGQAIGRLGCHFIGDHIGRPTSLPWGIELGGGITHPVSLYESIALLVIFFLLYQHLSNQEEINKHHKRAMSS